MSSARLSPRGLAAAGTAFTIWGLFPVYLHALSAVPAIQIIAHRVAWSCLLLLGWMLARRDLGRLTTTLGKPRLLAGLATSSLLITCNWLVYVWSVTHQHIVVLRKEVPRRRRTHGAGAQTGRTPAAT